HRHHEPVREQQHVEEQRADGGDAEDAEPRPCRLADEAAPREPHRVRGADESPPSWDVALSLLPGVSRSLMRAHRRASRSPLRRRSAHDASTVAADPSGTAIATHVSATSLVTRTNTSAVSYRHWKNTLISPCESTARTNPKAAPTAATSSPSRKICTRMRRIGRPMSRRTPTVSR